MSLSNLMRRTNWYPTAHRLRGVLFPGTVTLLRLLDRITRRPRWPRRDQPLPIVCLRHPASAASPLAVLVHRLETARGRRVPSARLDGAVPPGTDRVRTLRPLLDEAVAQLSSKVRRSPRLRFPHYGLASWLLDLTVPPDTRSDQEERHIADELRDYLRRYVSGGRTTGSGASLDLTQGFPWWIRLASAFAPRLGLTAMALLWRPPRWIGRQRIGDRECHTTYRLARAFAREQLATTHPDEVADFLVNAFLEDLRRAYRRWTILGTGRRRTAYPCLLIDGVAADTAGACLISAVGRVRDSVDTRRQDPLSARTWRVRFDPLLVVAAGAWAPSAHPYSPDGAHTAYLDWLHDLYRAGRQREWTLSFEADVSAPANDQSDRIFELGPMRLRRPLAGMIALLFVPVGLVSVPVVNHARCDAWWSVSASSPLTRVGDQCVGVSTNPLVDFVPDDVPHEVRVDLRDVYRKIMDGNERAAGHSTAIALVYLGVLTPRTSSSYRALIEELRGMVVAQGSSPIPLRVLVANGGERMANGGIAADKILELADKDPRIVAVAGISFSTDGAKDAIKRIGGNRHPLAVIGTLTSADDMADINSYYHQVGPNNRREAEVSALYAKNVIGASGVSIFFSADPTDRYSRNLAEDARIAFAGRGFQIRQYERFRTADDHDAPTPTKLGARACSSGGTETGTAARPGGTSEVVFYAGRSEHLREFLTGLNLACGDNPPAIVAGDSVTRFVLDRRTQEFPNLQLHYISFASPVAWADCREIPFYHKYFTLFGGDCGTLIDGRSALAHDAAQIVVEGAGNARAKDPSASVRAGLLNGIKQIRDRGIQGASGIISFDASSGLPIDKATLVLRSDSDGSVTLRFYCGGLPYNPRLAPDSACPHDRR